MPPERSTVHDPPFDKLRTSQSTALSKRLASRIMRRLKSCYPNARCSLDFSSPLELLVATILSAQCTDTRVNLVTRDLFRKYRTPLDYALADAADLQQDNNSTGFNRNKASHIQACCQRLVDEYGGLVPRDLDRLVVLPGVGRKTANVVLGTAFGIASGVVVDTHVGRISRRLGLTSHRDPVKVERDLMALLNPRDWVYFSHALIQHGRLVCTALRPDCEDCPLADLCPRIGLEPPSNGPLRRAARTPPA
jgi:endonuclease-3